MRLDINYSGTYYLKQEIEFEISLKESLDIWRYVIFWIICFCSGKLIIDLSHLWGCKFEGKQAGQ